MRQSSFVGRKLVWAIATAWYALINIAYYYYQFTQVPYPGQMRWDYPNLLASLRAVLK